MSTNDPQNLFRTKWPKVRTEKMRLGLLKLALFLYNTGPRKGKVTFKVKISWHLKIWTFDV
jgi:hypothetical protein